MSLHQAEAMAIVVAMLVLFAWGRLRYDVVAALALAVALLTGVVPAERGFQGFANPVIIIIASVLVLSRAIAVSGVVELAVRRLMRHLASTSLQIGALTAAVALLSAFMKNVGALGIFMPIAIQTAERRDRPPSAYLMPLAFASLIGGTVTQIGTSPNLLISTVRQRLEGHPFTLFDFAPVGLPLTALAVLFLAYGWGLIPQRRNSQRSAERRFEIENYQSEAIIPAASPFVGRTVEDVEDQGEGQVAVTAIIREGNRRYIPNGDWRLFAEDVLVLQADPAVLKPFLDHGQLKLVGATEMPLLVPAEEEMEAIEAVLTAQSPMLGLTPSELHLRRRYEVNLLAVSRGSHRVTTRLSRTRFQVGDVVVLQGRAKTLLERISQLGCLPLAERYLTVGSKRPRYLPLIILVGAMVAVTLNLVSVEVAFFVAAVLVVLLKLLTAKEAYEAIDWPIVVMLGALIPVGEALKETGAAGLIGDGLTMLAAHLPGSLAVGLILLTSMLVTPFMHHAAAVLVMGPVAGVVAQNLHFAPDAFLMAVALGASCDFLTPIGHQNNLLVMGPGGYRFGDYWRLGLPLSLLVLLIGTPLIVHTWPLR